MSVASMIPYEVYRWVHIIFGTLALWAGIQAIWLRRRRSHRQWGLIYHGSVFLTCLGSIGVSLLRWSEFAHFAYISAVAYLLIVFGHLEVWRRKQGWMLRHLILMGSSYVTLVSGVLVQFHWRIPYWNYLPEIVSWTLPGVIGGVLIHRLAQEV